jgi:FkbM family methyltransferase
MLRRVPYRVLLGIHGASYAVKRVDYPRHAVYIRLTTPREIGRADAVHKEPWTVEWIESHVRPGDVLFDVGANVGAYSLIAARFSEGRARVFAFEPSFPNFASLCWNVAYNGCQDTVVPLQIGLYSGKGLTMFHYSSLAAGAALHTLGDHTAFAAATPVHRQPVLTYGLDELCQDFGIPCPNLIKLDVDGTELEIIKGAARALAHTALRSVLIELSEDTEGSDQEVIRRLEGAGLRVTLKRKRKPEQPVSFYVFER